MALGASSGFAARLPLMPPTKGIRNVSFVNGRVPECPAGVERPGATRPSRLWLRGGRLFGVAAVLGLRESGRGKYPFSSFEPPGSTHSRYFSGLESPPQKSVSSRQTIGGQRVSSYAPHRNGPRIGVWVAQDNL